MFSNDQLVSIAKDMERKPLGKLSNGPKWVNVETKSPKVIISEFHRQHPDVFVRSPLQVVEFADLPDNLPKPKIRRNTKRITGPCRDPSGSCPKEARVKGLCWTHYTQQLRLSKMDPDADPTDPTRQCCEVDCDKPKRVKGRCWTHYTKELKQRKQKERLSNVSGTVCAAVDCNSITYYKRYCVLHGDAKRCRVYDCQLLAIQTGYCAIHVGKVQEENLPPPLCRHENCNRRAMIQNVCLFHAENSISGKGAVVSSI